MRVLRTVAQLRAAIGEARRDDGATVGLVPTMGALHEGHLSLVRAARSAHELVVVSIFVNPTQFNDSADLAAYPRQERRDLELAEQAGVDIVFAPEAVEMYPDGFATRVHVGGALTSALEGAMRGSAHFDGVATVVSKLLLAALPDAAYFGQKDAQQLLVIRRMVEDLGIPSRIVGCPTSREADGLARSSRNQRLSAEERARAAAIPRALEAVVGAVVTGETRTDELRARGEAVLALSGIEAEYLAFVDPASLEPVHMIEGHVLCAIAARVGDVRLIDNVLLDRGSGRREED